MKLFQEVAIVTDARTYEEATLLRLWLESLRLHVRFFRITQTRQLTEFFVEEAHRHAWTVLMTHGTGSAVQFRLAHQVNHQWEAVDGWREENVDITPQWIADNVRQRPRGTLMSLACGGGRGGLPEAFLGAGYAAYVAMEPDYADSDSSLLFFMSVFHFLMAEDRDLAPTSYSLAESVEAAQKVDPWQFGTSAFRCYGDGSLR